jgi:tartrate dehydratase alpha subunit/fumarate hydratase class I-like protein
MRAKRKIKMRKINSSQVKDKVKERFFKANYHIDSDLIQRLEGALKDETSPRCLLRVISTRSPKTRDGKDHGL